MRPIFVDHDLQSEAKGIHPEVGAAVITHRRKEKEKAHLPIQMNKSSEVKLYKCRVGADITNAPYLV